MGHDSVRQIEDYDAGGVVVLRERDERVETP
ncbi:hypothetical protein HD597_001121 [Nonomuraea thailandensis]|uniref:Uncharacterized protein n=1 Tax=Nonomuraea thailandensis TaxID=1188745 RepID=A0A9X2K211_9ACTN|nr:hypothetical protein [Nonomuraea thailandensis]